MWPFVKILSIAVNGENKRQKLWAQIENDILYMFMKDYMLLQKQLEIIVDYLNNK